MITVILKGKMDNEEQKKRFLQIAKQLQENVVKEEGNNSYKILVNQNDWLEIYLCEEYIDAKAIEVHGEKSYSQELFPQLLELCSQSELVMLDEI